MQEIKRAEVSRQEEEKKERVVARAERIIEPPKKTQQPVVLPQVLKEGYLYKKSRYLKKWKLRWVVVMSNGTAYTYLTNEDKSQPTETFNLIAFM